MPSSVSLRARVFQLAEFTESYLLPVMYFYQAWGMTGRLKVWPAESMEQGVWLVRTVQDLDLLFVYLLIGVLLLFRRPAVEGPRLYKEVLVPLAVTLFFLAYGLPKYLPPALNESFVPESMRIPGVLASMVSGAAGSLVAVWGVISLGRSFGIAVAVRKVVLAGPYRYVRHPIYSGYLFIWLGLVLANPSPAMLALVLIHTLLMIYRARLEERRLAEASPEYRAYLQQTGFLFPRLDTPLGRARGETR